MPSKFSELLRDGWLCEGDVLYYKYKGQRFSAVIRQGAISFVSLSGEHLRVNAPTRWLKFCVKQYADARKEKLPTTVITGMKAWVIRDGVEMTLEKMAFLAYAGEDVAPSGVEQVGMKLPSASSATFKQSKTRGVGGPRSANTASRSITRASGRKRSLLDSESNKPMKRHFSTTLSSSLVPKTTLPLFATGSRIVHTEDLPVTTEASFACDYLARIGSPLQTKSQVIEAFEIGNLLAGTRSQCFPRHHATALATTTTTTTPTISASQALELDSSEESPLVLSQD
jgi:hypothetical protein